MELLLVPLWEASFLKLKIFLKKQINELRNIQD